MAEKTDIEYFKVGKHKGVVIDEAWDWDGGFIIFYCENCKKLHIYKTELASGTTELLRGEKYFESNLEDYTPNYICYPEVKAKAEKLGFKVED